MTEDEGRVSPDDLFFRSVVDGYLANPRFLRRDWLTADLEARLRIPNCRFVLLIAEPGAGKSTFIAQLAHDHPEWLRYFIRRDQRTPLAGVGAHSFLLRLGYQLAALHPECFSQEQIRLTIEQRVGTVAEPGTVVGAEVKRVLASPFYQNVQNVLRIQQRVERTHGSVVGLRIEELVVDPGRLEISSLQQMALFDPARALLQRSGRQQLVILVDALDEIRYHNTRENILTWLTACPALPENVRFVLTSRPPDVALNTFLEKQAPSLQTLTVGAADHRVREDTRVYVQRLVSEEAVAAELAQLEMNVPEFAGRAVEKAGGNIGYLDALARGVDQAVARRDDQALQQLLALRDLPDEIEGLYAFFLHQIKSGVAQQSVEVEDPETGALRFRLAWPAVYAPILGLLAVAFAPLSLSQLRRLGGIAAAREDLVEAIDRLQQFLERVDGCYRLYHTTVAEFLTAPETATHSETSDLSVDPSRWHRQIVLAYRGTAPTWDRVDWHQVDEYGLLYLAGHLVALRDDPSFRREVHGLICQPFMREKFIRTHSYRAFAADVALAIDVAAASPSPEDMVQLVRHCLVDATLHESATDIPLSALYTLTLVGQAASARGYAALIKDAAKRITAYSLICAALVDRGEFQEAGDLVEQIGALAEASGDEIDTASALGWAALAFARIGNLDGAVRTARRALASGEGISVYTAAWTLALAGDMAEVEHAKAAGAPAAALADLARVVAVLADLGEIELAVTAATDLLDLSAHFEDTLPELRANTLSHAALALARSGENTVAARLVAVTTSVMEAAGWRYPESKAPALSNVAHALAYLGDREQAARVAAHVLEMVDSHLAGDLPHAVDALALVAPVLARLGDQARVVRLVESALTLAESRSMNLKQRASLLSDVAQALASVGEKDRAAELATSAVAVVEVFEMDAGVLSALARTFAHVGQIDWGVAVVGMIQDDWSRADALGGVLPALVEAGRTGQALALVSTSVAESTRADAVRGLLPALVSSGQIDQALSLARTITEYWHRLFTEMAADGLPQASLAMKRRDIPVVDALVGLVHALVEVGAKESAAAEARQLLAVTRRLENPLVKAEKLGDIARSMIQAECAEGFDQVVADARALSPADRARALAGLALALARAGQVEIAVKTADEAIAAAENIPPALLEGQGILVGKALALSRVAAALVHAGEGARAATIARQALAGYAKDSSVPLWPAPREAGLRLTGWALLRAEGVGQALVAAEALSKDEDRAHVLGGMAEALIQARDPDGLNRLSEAAATIADEGARASGLSQIAGALIQVGATVQGWEVWRTAVVTAQPAGSRRLFEVLRRTSTCLATIDGGETLWQMLEAVQDVAGWWTPGSRAYG
ncbi:MAG: hypothetical protein M5U01_15225 [Ardenticatenaceae bacterium]|nr:hypothetical protein [Ardenticatenaceae bacterium]